MRRETEEEFKAEFGMSMAEFLDSIEICAKDPVTAPVIEMSIDTCEYDYVKEVES